MTEDQERYARAVSANFDRSRWHVCKPVNATAMLPSGNVSTFRDFRDYREALKYFRQIAGYCIARNGVIITERKANE